MKNRNMESLQLDVYGVSVRIESSNRDFLDFISKNYSRFCSSESDYPRLEIHFGEDSTPLAKAEKEHLSYIGQGCWMGDKRLYWENEFGFHVVVDVANSKQWKIWGFHDALLVAKTYEDIYQNFQRSMRWMIHFPLFILLEMEQSKGLLHSSAVSKNGQAIIFFGLNKVGKSGLCLAMVNKYGYQLMTDNFLLFDHENVYGFPERCRISPEGLQYFKNNEWQVSTETIYEKHHIDLPPEKVTLSSRPRAIFFVSFGDKLAVSKINSDNLVSIVQGVHHYLKEFPEYSFYALLPFLGMWKKRHNNFSLLKQIPFYHLTHTRDWKTCNTVEEILRYVH